MTLFFYLLSLSTFLSALIIYGMSFATSLVEMSDSNIRVTIKYRWLAWFRWIAMSIAWAAPPLLIGLPLQNDNGSVNWLTILSIYAIIATIAILGLHSLPDGIKVDQPRFRLSTITLFGIATAAIMTNVGLQFRNSFKFAEQQENAVEVESKESTYSHDSNPVSQGSLTLHNQSHPNQPKFWLSVRWPSTTTFWLHVYNPNIDEAFDQKFLFAGPSKTHIAFEDEAIDNDYVRVSSYRCPEVKAELEKTPFLIEGPLPSDEANGRRPLVCVILLCNADQLLDSSLHNSHESLDDILGFCKKNKIWCFYIQRNRN